MSTPISSINGNQIVLPDRYFNNIENGSFTVNNKTGTYTKYAAGKHKRLVVPVFIKSGTTIATKTGYKLLVVRYDLDWNFLGRSAFQTSYSFGVDCYCMMAFTNDADDHSIFADSLDDIVSGDGVYIINNSAVTSIYCENIEGKINEGISISNKYGSGDMVAVAFTATDALMPIGNTVNLNSPNYAAGWAYAVVDCSEGELFTVCGTGTNAGRLFAFIDSNGNTLDRSPSTYTLNGDVISAPANAAKAIFNVNTELPYYIYKGAHAQSVVLGRGSTDNAIDDCYIINDKSPVNFTPVSYKGYACIVAECAGGDVFTVTGVGGGSGRLWAFTDENNNIRKSAPGGCEASNDLVVAPPFATHVIFNWNKDYAFSAVRGYPSKSTPARIAEVPQATIFDMPKPPIAVPTIDFSQQVRQQSGVSIAKGAIYSNGDNYCVTFGENLDGTVKDFPDTSATGCLAIRYKKFKLTDGVESDVDYGYVAKKGDAYIDWEGNQSTLVGGCGLPSGAYGKQYFTSAYNGERRYNGMDNYGMTPCCCDVTVNADGSVQFGTIRELSLTISGTKGKFDLYRIDPENENYLLYMTTAHPYYDGTKWYWLQPAKHGIVYLTSTNGIDWTYVFTIATQYDPICEISCCSRGDSNVLTFAARTAGSHNVASSVSTLYVGDIQIGSRRLRTQYRLNDLSSRAYLVRSGNDALLFYNPYRKTIAECIRITEDTGDQGTLQFYRWFTLYKRASWYITCQPESVMSNGFDHMNIIGGNDSGPSLSSGMQFIRLGVDTTKPVRVVDIPESVA